MKRGTFSVCLALVAVGAAGCESGVGWRGAEYRRAVLAGLPQREWVNQADRADVPSGDGSDSRPALPALGESSVLEDYLIYAALNNPALEAQFARWKAALERIPQERSLPDPQFTFRYFVVRMGAGADMEQRQGAAFSQMFPWWRKLELRGGRAADEARTEREKFEAERLKLVYRIQKDYYDYYYLARSIETTREVRRLVENLEAVIRARYRAAAAGQADLIRAQIELGKVDNDLQTLEDMRGSAVAKLNAAMNRPVEAGLPWPVRFAAPAAALDEGQLLAMLQRFNPQLRGLDAQVDRERKGIDLAAQEYYPDIMVGAEWMDMTMIPGMGGSGEDGWALMATINLPIWWHKYAAGVREARLRHQAALRERREQSNALASDLKTALFELRNAKRKMDLYGQTLLPKAHEWVRAGEAAFRAGTMSFPDLIESVRIVLDFDLVRHRSLADYATRLAELEMLVSQPLPRQARPPVPAPATRPAQTAPAP